MRRTLLGCCEGCKHMTYGPSENCNNRYPKKQTCKGCRLYTDPMPMGTTLNGPPTGVTITCRCLQDATEQEIQNHVCKYRRSK